MSQAAADAEVAAGAPLPAETLAAGSQALPRLGRLPELLPPRLLAHEAARALQRPLESLAVGDSTAAASLPGPSSPAKRQPMQPLAGADMTLNLTVLLSVDKAITQWHTPPIP